MRILQICTAFYAGGIQRHIMELSDSLRLKGHEVFLAGEPGPWLDETTELDYLPLNLLDVSTHFNGDVSILSRILQACKCSFKLRSFLRRNRIELIHAHDSAPAIVAKLASIGMGIPIIITYHGSAPSRVRAFGRICRLTAQLIITPSHRCAVELNELAGVPIEILKVIGLGVQPAPTIATDRVEQHRKNLLGTDGKLLVVIIARLDYQKGLDILVEVVQKVKAHRQDIRFVVIGDGPLRNDVREWAINANIEKLLHFYGESNEPYLYLNAADVFLLTSRWEALPITIAEAFQAGLPVVATDTGGVKELVEPSVGRVLPVGDADALCASILEICGNDVQRRTMSNEAIRLSREDRFSIPHVHEIFERTYADILKN